MMLKHIEDVAMETLRENQLDNVCDTAFALDPEFTPHYSAMSLELAGLAGYQLRVVGGQFSLTTVPYHASTDQIRAATRHALRVLMVKMRNQAEKWLEANPDTKQASTGDPLQTLELTAHTVAGEQQYRLTFAPKFMMRMPVSEVGRKSLHVALAEYMRKVADLVEARGDG